MTSGSQMLFVEKCTLENGRVPPHLTDWSSVSSAAACCCCQAIKTWHHLCQEPWDEDRLRPVDHFPRCWLDPLKYPFVLWHRKSFCLLKNFQSVAEFLFWRPSRTWSNSGIEEQLKRKQCQWLCACAHVCWIVSINWISDLCRLVATVPTPRRRILTTHKLLVLHTVVLLCLLASLHVQIVVHLSWHQLIILDNA